MTVPAGAVTSVSSQPLNHRGRRVPEITLNYMFRISTSAPDATRDRLLITRIVTCVALSLLLLLTGAGIGHAEAADVSAPYSGTVQTDQEEPRSDNAVTVPTATQAEGFGLVLCAIGLFCGLLILLTPQGGVQRRRVHVYARLRPLPLSLIPWVQAPPRAPTPSLLSISRT